MCQVFHIYNKNDGRYQQRFESRGKGQVKMKFNQSIKLKLGERLKGANKCHQNAI